jgi:hypothetical protein
MNLNLLPIAPVCLDHSVGPNMAEGKSKRSLSQDIAKERKHGSISPTIYFWVTFDDF